MSATASNEDMHALLATQRAAFDADLAVPAQTRIDRLQRAVDLLVDNESTICGALNRDFGHRSRTASLMSDIVPPIRALKYARDNVERWMADEPRDIAEGYTKAGASARVTYHPKGVVGNIIPWNAPFNVGFSPLSAIFAAGNRAMIKPSEHTPHAAELMRELVQRYFDETELAVFPGGLAVAQAFAALPFDHLLYTGSPEVGRHILAAAAANLVPVTLELGGKCPVVIGRSADIAMTVDRIVLGKMINAGQVCLSPDYLLVPKEMESAIADRIVEVASATYPGVEENGDYTAVIDDRQRARLDGLLADANNQGAKIIQAHGGPVCDGKKRPLTLICNVHDQMRVTREEIFGPILPIIPYDDIGQALRYINVRPRPLGLYYFGRDEAEEAMILSSTISGGVTVNDVIAHVAHEQLPFGGVGNSGMGAYHGFDGFKTFSHGRAVYRQTSVDLAGLSGARPPFSEKIIQTLEAALTK
jgi:coniferyl-aldehyde dehydrogenase